MVMILGGRRRGFPAAPGGIGFGGRRRKSPLGIRLLLGLLIGGFALVSYMCSSQVNPITGEEQRVGNLSTDQEIALGLQAAPELAAQHGGADPDPQAQAHVDQIGAELLAALDQELRSAGRENPFQFEFTLLDDPQLVNAFALPGGQVFITEALYRRLETDGQLAAVLGHEIGHVLSRHGAQQLAKQQLTQGLVMATGVASEDMRAGAVAAAVSQLVTMKYGREAEHESDRWGVRLAAAAGYDPRAINGLMKILEESGGGGPPEFMSTHPKPANRVQYIEEVIAQEFPDGVPPGLRP